MLNTILNRLKPQAEKVIAEEQAGFRAVCWLVGALSPVNRRGLHQGCFIAGRSTTEQIFNLRILCEKYLQQRQDLYHVFIDFKKAFDRVWHAA